MKKNVGSIDRAARGLGAIGMIVCALLAPLPLELRIVMGVMGAYWVFTAFAGTCLGYRLMGLSTCRTAVVRPIQPRLEQNDGGRGT